MNIVILAGNLVRDPEKTYTNSGMAVVRFTIAINRFTRKEGAESADFIRVTAFDKQAEMVEKYLRKGSKVGVEGRLQTGSYEKDGKTVYTTDVIANRVEFMDKKDQSGAGGFGGQFSGESEHSAPAPQRKQSEPASAPDGFSPIDDEFDDMPF